MNHNPDIPRLGYTGQRPYDQHDDHRFGPAHEPARGMGVAAMVCGIVGVVFGLIPFLFVLSTSLGAVAFILGAVAFRKRRGLGVGRGMATTGIVLGALALVLGVVGFVVVTSAFDEAEDDLEQFDAEVGDFDRVDVDVDE